MLRREEELKTRLGELEERELALKVREAAIEEKERKERERDERHEERKKKRLSRELDKNVRLPVPFPFSTQLIRSQTLHPESADKH